MYNYIKYEIKLKYQQEIGLLLQSHLFINNSWYIKISWKYDGTQKYKTHIKIFNSRLNLQ